MLVAACATPRVAVLTPDAALVSHGSYDVVILGGRVIDPESGLDELRNVGITDGEVRIITEQTIEGRTRIDANGLVVAPGFIARAYGGALRISSADRVRACRRATVGTRDYYGDAWISRVVGR